MHDYITTGATSSSSFIMASFSAIVLAMILPSSAIHHNQPNKNQRVAVTAVACLVHGTTAIAMRWQHVRIVQPWLIHHSLSYVAAIQMSVR